MGAMMQSSSARHHPGTAPRPKGEATGGAIGILLELGKFGSLLFCILSLYALFHTVFFLPFSGSHEWLVASFEMFGLAAAVCWASGWIFAEDDRRQSARNPSVTETLPMKIFGWVALAILILFLISWYLEKYFLPLRAQPLW
jgi:hypothetical protein